MWLTDLIKPDGPYIKGQMVKFIIFIVLMEVISKLCIFSIKLFQKQYKAIKNKQDLLIYWMLITDNGMDILE